MALLGFFGCNMRESVFLFFRKQVQDYVGNTWGNV